MFSIRPFLSLLLLLSFGLSAAASSLAITCNQPDGTSRIEVNPSVEHCDSSADTIDRVSVLRTCTDRPYEPNVSPMQPSAQVRLTLEWAALPDVLQLARIILDTGSQTGITLSDTADSDGNASTHSTLATIILIV